MPRFKPRWSTFNSLHKTSGNNTLAQLPGLPDTFRRRSHETKTSSAPHTSSDEALPVSGGIGDDCARGFLGHRLSRNRPALSDLSRRSISCGSVARSTAPRSPYPWLAGLSAVAPPATSHDHTREPCDLPALYAGRTRLDPTTPSPGPSLRSWNYCAAMTYSLMPCYFS